MTSAFKLGQRAVIDDEEHPACGAKVVVVNNLGCNRVLVRDVQEGDFHNVHADQLAHLLAPPGLHPLRVRVTVFYRDQREPARLDVPTRTPEAAATLIDAIAAAQLEDPGVVANAFDLVRWSPTGWESWHDADGNGIERYLGGGR